MMKSQPTSLLVNNELINEPKKIANATYKAQYIIMVKSSQNISSWSRVYEIS